MIVLDTSAAAEWLLGLRHRDAVAEAVVGSALHAPHLLTVELAQVCRRLSLQGSLPDDRATAALTDLADLDVTLYDHTPLLPLIWALRGSVSSYDAAFVALAQALDAPLLTCDARLARAVGPTADVRVIG